jgi:hypothetical protein
MTPEMSRADFDKLPDNEKRHALAKYKLVDETPDVVPNPIRLVLIENGTKLTFTRAEFEALDIIEKARIGRRLIVERNPPAAPPIAPQPASGVKA